MSGIYYLVSKFLPNDGKISLQDESRLFIKRQNN